MWGAAENFHEGWYYRELYRNLGLMLVQYLPWMFIPMVAALAGLWRPWIGFALHLLLAASAVALFGVGSAATRYLVLPIVVLGVMWAYGRPTPARWARRILIEIPLLIAVGVGAYPGWRAITRPDRVEESMQRIPGRGLALVWAPAGPGWGDSASWNDAMRNCARLTRDGRALTDEPQDLWRVPTADEVVRTMAYRGQNADGRWDPTTGRARYRMLPDKEAPLWHPYRPVIYLWTADTRGPDRAYFVGPSGSVSARPKTTHARYHGYRCVLVE